MRHESLGEVIQFKIVGVRAESPVRQPEPVYEQ